MKNYLIIVLFFSILRLYSEPLTTYYFVNVTDNSGVVLTPRPGIYPSDIEITADSSVGSIYYYYGNNLGIAEPIPYTKPLFLKGEKGFIKEYTIYFLLELDDGRVEYHTAAYMIDESGEYGLNQMAQPQPQQPSPLYSIKRNKNGTEEITANGDVTVEVTDRKINLSPLASGAAKVLYTPEPAQYNEYYVKTFQYDASYLKTRYEFYSLDLAPLKAPELGSLWWGQRYKQDEKIEIRNPNDHGQIYYWMREWKNDEIMTGPPLVNDIARWTPYHEPFKLSGLYGSEGSIGIAAVIADDNGAHSAIAGPYYIGVDETATKIQSFAGVTDAAGQEKKVLLNGAPITSPYQLISSAQCSVTFEGYRTNEYFYFEYAGEESSGSSGLLPCQGSYEFYTDDENEYQVTITMSDGRVITHLLFGKNCIDQPRTVGYKSDFIEATTDIVLHFYLPQDKIVKYRLSENSNTLYERSAPLQEFSGAASFTSPENEDHTYKLSLFTYTEECAAVEESNYLVEIDKKKPDNALSIKGYMPQMVYNDTIVVSVEGIEQGEKLYYQCGTNDRWFLYEKGITLLPPDTGISRISLSFKREDRAGNVTIWPETYTFQFDRRAIFVDTTIENSGNGTEAYPVNSIEKAVKYCHDKRIKLINMVSLYNTVVHALDVDSDIIIQPFNEGNHFQIIFDSKSIWKKEFSWFSVAKGCYFSLRNADIVINAGNQLVAGTEIKAACYNTDFSFLGNDAFALFDVANSYVSIADTIFTVPNRAEEIKMVTGNASQLIIKKVNADISANKITMFDCTNESTFALSESVFVFNPVSSLQLLRGTNAIVTTEKITVTIHTEKSDIKLCSFARSNFTAEKWLVEMETEASFNTELLELTLSTAALTQYQARIYGGNNAIGINAVYSRCSVDSCLIDMRNMAEFIYGVRGEHSNLELVSSIMRVDKTDTGATLVVADSEVQSVNNSFFVTDISGRAFQYWITHDAKLTTINSLYYLSAAENVKRSLIYINNPSYTAFTPRWLANTVSMDCNILENLDRADSDKIVKDFIASNLYYDLTDTFDLKRDDFFMPLITDQIGEAGIDERKSPLPIPEFDFYGKSRLMQGYGVDIGAVQLTGNKKSP